MTTRDIKPDNVREGEGEHPDRVAMLPLYDTNPVYRATYEAFFSGFKRWPAKAKDAVSLKQLRELARFVAEQACANHAKDTP